MRQKIWIDPYLPDYYAHAKALITLPVHFETVQEQVESDIQLRRGEAPDLFIEGLESMSALLDADLIGADEKLVVFKVSHGTPMEATEIKKFTQTMSSQIGLDSGLDFKFSERTSAQFVSAQQGRILISGLFSVSQIGDEVFYLCISDRNRRMEVRIPKSYNASPASISFFDGKGSSIVRPIYESAAKYYWRKRIK